nr:immunoglobulin heavy chain junction region [Mus musculus]
CARSYDYGGWCFDVW